MRISIEMEPQINTDERRFIESGIERIFSDYIYSNLINSSRRAQRLILHLLSEIGNMLPQRLRTLMTRIRRIFTDNFDLCVSVSSVQSVFYYIPSCAARASAFIMPKPCGFSRPKPNGSRLRAHVCPCGAYVDTPSRGVTLGVHLRLNNRAGGV
jgi:hypothetical protein